MLSSIINYAKSAWKIEERFWKVFWLLGVVGLVSSLSLLLLFDAFKLGIVLKYYFFYLSIYSLVLIKLHFMYLLRVHSFLERLLCNIQILLNTVLLHLFFVTSLSFFVYLRYSDMSGITKLTFQLLFLCQISVMCIFYFKIFNLVKLKFFGKLKED